MYRYMILMNYFRYQDAAEYYKLLLKQIGVDCHATFLNAGKFIVIQGAKAEKNHAGLRNEWGIKFRLSEEAEGDLDTDIPATVERARQAATALAAALTSLNQSEEKVVTNQQQRHQLELGYDDVFKFLRSTIETPSLAEMKVNGLPDLQKFGLVSSVAKYRDYKNDQNGLLSTPPKLLGELIVYETWFRDLYFNGQVSSFSSFIPSSSTII